MKIRAISTSTRLEHPCQFLLPLFDLKRFHPPGASNAIGQEKNDGHIDDAIDKTSVLTEVTPQTEIPQTEDSRAEVMINASWGLSESIVGGAVTPDTFIVCKSDLAVGQRVIADKQHMTVSTPGGTHEVDVPRFPSQ